MALGVSRPTLLLATLCLSGCVGLWQIDSVREALRGHTAPPGPGIPARDTLPPGSEGPSAGSLEDDLWDVYPVVLEVREEVILVSAEEVLLAANVHKVPAHPRRIFHVPVS